MKIKKLATHIVQVLQQEGYIAYFAGGWVRDFIMNNPSSDIDIATNAPLQVILDLFPQTILVGLSFGVIIVVLEGHQFEVSTFRKDFDYHSGRRPSRIELATPEEDASRRDFTINGMFYDPLTEQIYDYVGGIEDIHKQVIRTIGNPSDRFYEDRLRMIRALRFAGRFNFHIDFKTQDAIAENAETLFPAVAMERIWQEFEKMAQYGRFEWTLIEMHRLGLLGVIFPQLKGVHLNEIKHRLQALNCFPKNTPTILLLKQLFQNSPLKEMQELVQYLKTSNRNLLFIELWYEASKLILEGGSPKQWAYYLSKEEALVVAEVVLANLAPQQRLLKLQEIQNWQTQLYLQIERLTKKTPLIKSDDLKQLGIVPGPQMGKLLKEAEEIAINGYLEDKEKVLSLLKNSNHWPINEESP